MVELRRRLGTRRELRRSAPLTGVTVTGAAVPDGAAVEVDLVLESIPEAVVVAGSLSVPWVGECRRCLDPVAGILEVEVGEVFEARPTEGETWPLDGDEMDLEPMVSESVLLALPIAPLCSEDCRGPAPEVFPAVPAEGATADDDPPGDPRWGALAALQLDRDPPPDPS